MIQRRKRADAVRLTFSLPSTDVDAPVSVVGDFNDWTPGAHELRPRSNGRHSVAVDVRPGAPVRFRYLADGGHWFDDPDADESDPRGGIVRT